ncbi:aminotransferase class I/II-fold pyridoxal phosphate-dependent enzyme [Bacillus coagulans]|jgi:GntR family transcriptional regulator of abcA and norABC|uniref:PLP-dependent aminotransferase family protein n=2 Tax=Heyndrickxia TaxID=2837504 RepID=A0A150KK57_HEYCO|nr:PLP-dependent aminotransferase family protein [Heyndrickxia coagulans]KYC73668.1 Transcriptional regulator, GntR family domain [Heyndrickxia coagulans]MDL5042180.1 PLP-dependent aminotransferase family protein [Heyndrickxia coagulans]NCG67568.1 aminotransferase class I/II-fold pyridoxal phosphate-dependent enzyme [Heyndrickxia coagulans]
MADNWTLNKHSDIPLYQQIYEYIKAKILNGEWPVGTRLPTQRELARKFEVNRSTVVYALGELAAEGLIESKVGKGTAVANNTWSLLASAQPPDWHHYVKAGTYEPNKPFIQEINKAEANPQMIRLGTGELSPELLPAEHIRNIFQNCHRKITLGYPEPKGSFDLREMISIYLKAKGIIASPSSIMVVSGGIQALQFISLGLLQRGSAIFHEIPSYLQSLHVFQSAGMNLFGIRMDHDGIVTEGIGKLKRQHNGALLYTIPNFHNPTGILMKETRRKALLAACINERLPVIEDDVYGDLWFDEKPPAPLKAKDDQGLVLYIGSMSKTLGPGLRIGWIAGPEPVINRLADIKMQTDYGSSALSQYAAAECLSSGFYSQYIEDIRTALKNRRDFTIGLLNRYFKGIATWDTPAGGFYIWLKLKKTLSMQKLFKLALREKILLNPGNIYDRNDHSHLRLSYSYASFPQLEKGLARLADIIQCMD